MASPARSATRGPEWMGADGGAERRSFDTDAGTGSVVAPIGLPPLAARAPLMASRVLAASTPAAACAEAGADAALGEGAPAELLLSSRVLPEVGVAVWPEVGF